MNWTVFGMGRQAQSFRCYRKSRNDALLRFPTWREARKWNWRHFHDGPGTALWQLTTLARGKLPPGQPGPIVTVSQYPFWKWLSNTNNQQEESLRMPNFAPCPFCGAEIFARPFDEISGEGDEDTKGKFVLVHGATAGLCPIEHYDREYLGMLTYDSPEDAAAIWNVPKGLNRA
ncbi:MAG: hypothetical protein FWC27_12395 [Firmicutes bacterium]|nr:hypothetical protein [Bacillota bacterium]